MSYDKKIKKNDNKRAKFITNRTNHIHKIKKREKGNIFMHKILI